MLSLTNQPENLIHHRSKEEDCSILVSVIVPVTERCEALVDIYRSYDEILRKKGVSFEFIIVIDDGFQTGGEALRSLALDEHTVKIIQLSRSFGESTALSIGFEQARGEYVFCVPSYPQVIAEGLPEMLEALEEGYDLVLAIRNPRKDGWVNKVQNHAFHSVVRWSSGLKFHDLGCGLRGMSKRVTRELQLYGDLHRFIPLLAHQKGFRILEVSVPQHAEDRVVRIYSIGVYLRRLLDIFSVVFLFKFVKKPLRFFGLIGVGLFVGGFLISLSLLIQKVLGLVSLSDRPLLILGVLLMVLGVQTGSIGLLGEIIIFTHARKMKDYSVDLFLK